MFSLIIPTDPTTSPDDILTSLESLSGCETEIDVLLIHEGAAPSCSGLPSGQFRCVSSGEAGFRGTLQAALSATESEGLAFCLPGDRLSTAGVAAMTKGLKEHDVVAGRVTLTKSGKTFSAKTESAQFARYWQFGWDEISMAYGLRREAIRALLEAEFEDEWAFLLECCRKYDIGTTGAMHGWAAPRPEKAKASALTRPVGLARYLETLPVAVRLNFLHEETAGRQWRQNAALQRLLAHNPDAVWNSPDVIWLPSSSSQEYDYFVQYDISLSRGDGVILVYQMGKVASKSIDASLRLLPPEVQPMPVYHVHVLRENCLEKTIRSPEYLPHHQAARMLSRTFREHFADLSWKVITVVREPVARILSGVFQRFAVDHQYASPAGNVAPDLEEVRRYVIDTRNYTLNYLTRELGQTCGVDVYAQPFDQEKGYEILSKGTVQILILKFERLKDNYPAAIHEFLGIEGVTLPRVNVTADKPDVIADSYKRIKETFSLPKNELDLFYSSPYVRHFYTEDEIAIFYDRFCE